jgi:hypothetical protein
MIIDLNNYINELLFIHRNRALFHDIDKRVLKEFNYSLL